MGEAGEAGGGKSKKLIYYRPRKNIKVLPHCSIFSIFVPVAAFVDVVEIVAVEATYTFPCHHKLLLLLNIVLYANYFVSDAPCSSYLHVWCTCKPRMC